MSLGNLQGMYSDLSFFVEMSVGICGLGLLVHTIRGGLWAASVMYR